MLELAEVNSAENDAAFAEMRGNAERIEGAEAAAKAEVAKRFDIRALAASTKKMCAVQSETLGEIKYMLLTSGEVNELKLEECKNQRQIMEKLCYRMLNKADPTITQDEFDAIPYDAKIALLQTLSSIITRFLHKSPPSG